MLATTMVATGVGITMKTTAREAIARNLAPTGGAWEGGAGAWARRGSGAARESGGFPGPGAETADRALVAASSCQGSDRRCSGLKELNRNRNHDAPIVFRILWGGRGL